MNTLCQALVLQPIAGAAEDAWLPTANYAWLPGSCLAKMALIEHSLNFLESLPGCCFVFLLVPGYFLVKHISEISLKKM